MLIHVECFILVTRGAKGAIRARGLRRSRRVEECYCETYAREEEEEEEVLNSSHQSTSTSQPSSTQQSSTTQRSSSPMIIIDSVDNREIIMKSQSHMPIITPDITSPTPTERQQS